MFSLPKIHLDLMLVAMMLLCGFVAVSAADKESVLPPPVANKIVKVDTTLGDIRADSYFWLRDKTDPDVIDYLEAENEYTDSIMAPAKGMQEQLYNEILSRIKETDLSVPEKIDDYYYYFRTEQGKQYHINCRKKGSLEATEEVILDQNELAKGLGYFSLGALAVSPNHQLIAYSVDTTGSETYTIFVKDLSTGQLMQETVERTGGTIVWANDGKTFFYDTLDETLRPYRIHRHVLGTDPGKDALVFEEPDKSYFVGISKTKSKAYIIIDLGSKITTEARYLDANNPAGEFKVIQPRQHGTEYYVSHHDNSFYILTNENAKNFKLMEAPVTNPGTANWKEVIPHRTDVLLEGTDAFKNFLIVLERENGLQKVQVRNYTDNSSFFIDFPEATYSVFPGRNPDYNSDKFRFTYQSLATQRSVYDYDVVTKSRNLLKQDEVLGGYDATLYQSERVFATASDGVRVPISIVYKKDLFKKDGTNPLYLYGYGAYGSSMDPWFSAGRLSLLNRGFVWAIAHVRGGGEMGRQWYDDGKLLKKMNTFTDFLACAEYLVKEKYANEEKVVATGGSAGGLLIGVVANMRPDLFKILVADVPFVDVLNTMLDESIPLTVTEYEEWGNPHEKEYYGYMKSYAPYENVTAKNYPNILITTSLNDPRVAYWEPAKWCAKLRATKTDGNLLVMKTNMDAGHGGASGRYQRIKEIAFEYAFILNVLGIGM